MFLQPASKALLSAPLVVTVLNPPRSMTLSTFRQPPNYQVAIEAPLWPSDTGQGMEDWSGIFLYFSPCFFPYCVLILSLSPFYLSVYCSCSLLSFLLLFLEIFFACFFCCCGLYVLFTISFPLTFLPFFAFYTSFVSFLIKLMIH